MQASFPFRMLTLVTCLATAQFVLADDREDFFESRIRPVLVKHCYECHSESSEIVQAGLRLDQPGAMRRGGDSGVVIVPGDPAGSMLISSIKYEGSEMPPSGPLDESVVRDFEKWIRQGAIDPRPENDSPATNPTPAIDFEKAREFWSFQPPQRWSTPSPIDDWPSEGFIDRFIHQRLIERDLRPNPTAPRQTLIRRVTFDLTGLPPTQREVEAFLNDERPDAYQRLVDRLLGSSQHGEHWTRMWLDVARYAEDQAHIVGNNDSLTYPNAYRYRSWVIDALASDLPYDDFVRRQLAADLQDPDHPETHLALGFLGLGPKYYRRNSPEVMADEWEDRIDTVSRGLLGLTVACARCHDHKYDPIPTTDYYGLAGVFASTEMYNRPVDGDVKVKNGQAAKPQDAVHIVRDGDPKDLNVMLRGDVSRKGELVPRRFLTVLASSEPHPLANGSGRADLAEEIVATGNPLTARVIVNRIWRQLMGSGIVETPSNFGVLGERPSHLELLDVLAIEFMREGWSLKWLQRQIVLSHAYRQTGDIQAGANEVDPENRLYWRMKPKRLGIESYRDAVLSVAQRLDRQVGGESLRPDDPTENRRTLYSKISRLDLNPLLARFDFPDPNAHSAKRVETTTPLQKLFLMNSEFIAAQAEELAQIILRAADSDQQRIQQLYERLFARRPTDKELQWGLTFVSNDPETAWPQYSQILLISNEMLFID